MKTRRVFIFTMTKWDEQPRLRHQVAKLLSEAGEEVHFFQGSRFPWRSKAPSDFMKIGENLNIHRGVHLFHLHLRVNSLIIFLNSIAERISIKLIARNLPEKQDIIINFNYDFYFLREIFPHNKIITIINDDFEAQAKFFKGKHVRSSLKRTCLVSDRVLTVSYPLIDKLREWCAPELFLPWADVPYCSPNANFRLRNAVLLWAYIDARIDFQLLAEVAKALPDSEFYIYGDCFKKIQPELDRIGLIDNVFLRPATKLDDIDLTRYYAAIIPYRRGPKDIEAVTLSNKTLQLLARGLPIVTSGMPHFYQHRAIRRAASASNFIAELNSCKLEFWDLQHSIERFVMENQPANRFLQLESTFDV